MKTALALLAICLAQPAFAQFSLYLVNGNVEEPVPASLDLGAVFPTQPASMAFRIRNTSSAAASLDLLAADGEGFTISGAPTLPVGLNPQQSFDFSVVFSAAVPGGYSASLLTEGAAVILTAQVVPGLTYQVVTATGAQTLGSAAVDFGPVQIGASAELHFTVTNLTSGVLAAPGFALQGSAFSMPDAPPAGVVFQPGDTSGFDVVFQPAAAGPASGTLTIGTLTFALTGTGVVPPMPVPQLDITLAQTQSNRTGTVAVPFAAAAQAAGTGILALAFQPLPAGATDPAIQLGVAGASLPFSFSAGDAQASLGGLSAVNFQTGTTAGTLVFTATIAGVSARQSIVIPPAPVAILSASGQRAPGSLTLNISAFDNTRTAGQITYIFYGTNGNPAVSPITADSTTAFAAYFASSTNGGNFDFQAVFPVTGNPSTIAAFEVQFANSAGTSTTGKVNF